MFGPEQSGSDVERPFGSAVVDGFDFDFESTTSNMAPFASELRSLMDAATGGGDKKYYLSAAPQCPYPDAADNEMLSGAVSFDLIWVQFYNNYCGVNSYVSGASAQNNYNFETWDDWAKTVSKNDEVKVLVGIPANTGAAGSGYVKGSQLASVLAYSEGFSSFGGVMMWDMSQLYANSGFLAEVVSGLGGAGGGGSTTTTTTTSSTKTSTATTTSTTSKTSSSSSTRSSAATTTTTTSSATTLTTSTKTTTSSSSSSSTPTSPAVAQWGQCGGIGYTGSTTCQSPYVCWCNSEWWCHCQF